jgi:hypothetical protein
MKTMPMRQAVAILTFGLVVGAAGCGTAREADAYRADTEKLLETRGPQLKSCYDEALKADRATAGTVTLQFVVEKDSGAITQPSIVAGKSTAPASLGQCLIKAVEGLKLEPGDRNEGRATFVYEFKPTAN